ncbi:DUF397 domain-containing protein [Actinoallomurus liliacearum]
MTISDAPATTQWRKSSYTAQGGADCVEVVHLVLAVASSDSSLADEA